MSWDGWRDFFAMGGYGLYVWGSFGMAALLLAWEVWALYGSSNKQNREAESQA